MLIKAVITGNYGRLAMGKDSCRFSNTRRLSRRWRGGVCDRRSSNLDPHHGFGASAVCQDGIFAATRKSPDFRGRSNLLALVAIFN
jgi:hypothetical protein